MMGVYDWNEVGFNKLWAQYIKMPIILFFIETLRALYLGDNEFEYIPPEIGNLKNLQIVSDKKKE